MSDINPYTINKDFPIAGQDNDSQGFRDNFSAIINALATAQSEIGDLQSKALLKSALNNIPLSNDAGGTELVNVLLRGWGQTLVDHGTIGNPSNPTSLTIDLSAGNVHNVTAGGPIILNFTGWQNSSFSSVKLYYTLGSPNYFLRLPSTVVIGYDSISNLVTNSIYGYKEIDFPEVTGTTTYLFEFTSYNGGLTISINDLSRAKSKIVGNLTVTAGRVNSGYILANVVNNQTIYANLMYNRWIINTSPYSSTISNLWINIPTSAEDGRELSFVSTIQCPLIFISNGGQNSTTGNIVQFLPNSWSTNGNVTATIMYSAQSQRWFKV